MNLQHLNFQRQEIQVLHEQVNRLDILEVLQILSTPQLNQYSADVKMPNAEGNSKMGAVTYLPIEWLSNVLQVVHDTSGLPWWATIAVCTLCVRLPLFPLMAANIKRSSRIKPLMAQLQMELKAAIERG